MRPHAPSLRPHAGAVRDLGGTWEAPGRHLGGTCGVAVRALWGMGGTCEGSVGALWDL